MKFVCFFVVLLSVTLVISQTQNGRRRRRTLAQTERARKMRDFLKRHGRLEGMVRLVDGTVPSEGNLEIFHQNRWGSICDDEWDKTDAEVVCRELGFPGVITATHNGLFGPAKHKFWLDNLYCSGAEKNLTECRHDGWGIHDCQESEVAGVRCKEGPRPIILEAEAPPVLSINISSPDFIQKDKPPKKTLFEVFGKKVKVRLVGGRITEEGRVEVQLGDKDWGVVCGDGWSLFEAMVICRQLGYGYAQDAIPTDYFGGNHSDIVLTGLSCRGTEKNLLQCMHEVDELTCPGRKGNIAAVTCVPEQADLIPDHYEIMRSAHLEDRQLFFLQCAMEENCVASSAYRLQKEDVNWHLETRRLLRFTAKITNIGTADFRPYIPRHMWQWHACHMHYHSMEVFAHFDVLDHTGRKVAEGHKASFCLEDNACNPGVVPRYKCANYGEQGISVGCTDTYAYNIDCQWVDITDIEPGMYTFRVVINPEFKVAEQSFENNAAICNLYYGPTFATVYNCTLSRP